MTIELRRPKPDDVPELGRICYEAFRHIAEAHGFPKDFVSPEFAVGIVGLLLSQERVYTSAAYDGERPRGSNFINMWGDVAGIGPISVDIEAQGEGIGKQLMQDVIAHALHVVASRPGHVDSCQETFRVGASLERVESR